jgi:putative SOS response-associated peptidase YedK
MCGRFALYASPARLKEHFATTNDLNLEPHFNIAPTQTVPVVRLDETGNRVFAFARWGLIPSWVKDPEKLQHPINAKAETAAIKPMFRHAYRKSRVLVPADAFYEWAPRNGKQPFLIRLRDGELIGMGGLLEHWQGPEGDVMTFTILTTDANSLMANIHDRMPVIIRPEDYAAWIDTNLTDISQIQSLVRLYPERLMEAYPISRKVNSLQHDSPDLIEEEQSIDEASSRLPSA